MKLRKGKWYRLVDGRSYRLMRCRPGEERCVFQDDVTRRFFYADRGEVLCRVPPCEFLDDNYLANSEDDYTPRPGETRSVANESAKV